MNFNGIECSFKDFNEISIILMKFNEFEWNLNDNYEI